MAVITHPSFESLLKKVDSKYTLVVLGAKRAREITEEGERGTLDRGGPKPVTVALEEIREGEVTFRRTKVGIK